MNLQTPRPYCSTCHHHAPAFLKTPDRKLFVVDVHQLAAPFAAGLIRDRLEPLEAKAAPARRIA